MATIFYLSGYPKDLVKDAKLIKQAGVKCTQVLERPIVEVATGKIVHMCYELTFKGNFFQCLKAERIMKSLHND
jgi:hypothetical protein